MSVVLVFLCIFFSIIAFLSSLIQPSQAYQQAGHSKPLWVLLNLVSLVTIFPSLVIVPIYLFKIRTDLLKQSGRTFGQIQGGQPTYTEGSNTGMFELGSQSRRPCSSCNGSKTLPCNCGNGYAQQSDGTVIPHSTCWGTGRVPCGMCGGTGTN